MRPLMSTESHRRFSNLRERLAHADGDAAQVFVPVMPAHGDGLRLLFVGQATRYWNEPELADYERSWRNSADVVASSPRASGYWQVVRRIVTDVCADLGMPDHAERLPGLIGWSNLVKIGHPDRNPSASSLELQTELCIEQLRHEVATMAPSAVVVMTRDFARDEVLLPVFGQTGWTNDVPEEDRVAWKLTPLPVIWMNHPRNMGPSGYRKGSVKTAVKVICEAYAQRT